MVQPGVVRDSQNYEVGIHGGYQDIEGYERFDGRPSPSDQIYQIIDVTISGTVAVDDVIEGATSGATATVLRVVDTAHADYLDTVYLVLAKVSGTFQATEGLEVSAVEQASALSANKPSAARTSKLHAQYLALSADLYRQDISTVPGQGSVWGLFKLGSLWYAMRDKSGGLTSGLYKQDASSGWVEVALGYEMEFTSGGTVEVSVGTTIVGATSSASMYVARVVLESGSWAGGDAAGRFIATTAPTGTFQAAETLNFGANTNVATVTADATAITMEPGGRLVYDKSSAFSSAAGSRVYGATGVDRGFEFDGTIYAPINTGMTTDTPDHVIVHQHHVFFSFGASVQHSGLGLPHNWTPVLGASELNVGDDVTGFNREPGDAGDGALAIFSRNRIHILYGTSSADWNLEPYREEVGAFAHTVQQVGSTLFLHDRGLTSLRTVQAFGNFAHNTLSNHIQSWLIGRRSSATASCIVRDKSQYRVFFSDQWALYVTMDGQKVMGMMPVKLSTPVTCIASEENSDGSEDIMFGSSDGYVYQLDKGTSFDGSAIQGFLILHFFYPKSSLGWIKRWLLASLEVRGEGYSEFQFSYDLAYGDGQEVTQPSIETKALDNTPVVWGQFVWDQFVWDARELNPSRLQLSGESENLSLALRRNSDYMEPMRFSGAVVRYIMRPRQVRS